MSENIDPKAGLRDTPSPSEFPIGSPESRAAARLFLERGAARILKWYCVEAPELDADESPIKGPIRECEPASATLCGFPLPPVEFVRAENETAAEFEKRVYDSVPVAGPPGNNEHFLWSLTFHPRKDSPDQAS